MWAALANGHMWSLQLQPNITQVHGNMQHLGIRACCSSSKVANSILGFQQSVGVPMGHNIITVVDVLKTSMTYRTQKHRTMGKPGPYGWQTPKGTTLTVCILLYVLTNLMISNFSLVPCQNSSPIQISSLPSPVNGILVLLWPRVAVCMSSTWRALLHLSGPRLLKWALG